MARERRQTREPAGEKEPKPRLTHRMAKLLEMPESALSGEPTVEFSGNGEAVVDGCKGVIEYGEGVIRLSTGRMILRFTGRNLQLRCMTAENAIITGYIQSLEFTS